jgi:hypothetical protein
VHAVSTFDHQNFYLLLQQVVKLQKGLKKIPLSYLISSQIWLNLLVDDQHQLG